MATTTTTFDDNANNTTISSKDVKISFNSIVRRFIVPKNISWHDFEEQLRKRFSVSSSLPLSLSYKDEDGDIITLSSTEELSEVLDSGNNISNGNCTIVFSMSLAGDEQNGNAAAAWIFEGSEQQQRSSTVSSTIETGNLIELSENEEQPPPPEVQQKTEEENRDEDHAEANENSNLINEQERRQQLDQDEIPPIARVFRTISTASNITDQILDSAEENFDEWITRFFSSRFGQGITPCTHCGSSNNNTQSHHHSNEDDTFPSNFPRPPQPPTGGNPPNFPWPPQSPTDGNTPNFPRPPQPPTDPPHRRPPGPPRVPGDPLPGFPRPPNVHPGHPPLFCILHHVHGRGGWHCGLPNRHGPGWRNHHHPPPPFWWGRRGGWGRGW
ncbi:6816_t:CDS:2 [Ambispora gerdemannii]|uniref:6816_t:CDS:1 n=1 Tax=Ambispora gerdemannii TaxID=144530 RepID=A0A9N8VPF4_9GLOM|nr:6816_t:CDS:2 [Ambispora gerdemannii]